MNSFKTPQDRRPSSQEMLNNALRLQSANMAQKATLDVMGGKLIMIMSVLKKDWSLSPEVARLADELRAITSMTRSQVSEHRSAPEFQYPDVEIQAAINKAADEILQLLLPKGNDE